jgi:flagellar biosynthesis protein FlhB
MRNLRMTRQEVKEEYKRLEGRSFGKTKNARLTASSGLIKE